MYFLFLSCLPRPTGHVSSRQDSRGHREHWRRSSRRRKCDKCSKRGRWVSLTVRCCSKNHLSWGPMILPIGKRMVKLRLRIRCHSGCTVLTGGLVRICFLAEIWECVKTVLELVSGEQWQRVSASAVLSIAVCLCHYRDSRWWDFKRSSWHNSNSNSSSSRSRGPATCEWLCGFTFSNIVGFHFLQCCSGCATGVSQLGLRTKWNQYENLQHRHLSGSVRGNLVHIRQLCHMCRKVCHSLILCQSIVLLLSDLTDAYYFG